MHMKLPALWILTAFVAGIGAAERWPATPKLWAVVAASGVLAGGILAAGFLRWRHCAVAAWVFALVAWAAIGGLAAGVERAEVPTNHIARLIAAGRVDTGIALRWRGRLREDPLALPWGQRFEIDLEQVEAAGATLNTSGGLRVNFYPGPRVAEPPVGLRAGDRVEVLVKARPPRDYLDPGAFDVKGFLAREKIDLIGSLRSGELLQLVDRPPPYYFTPAGPRAWSFAHAAGFAFRRTSGARSGGACDVARRPQLCGFQRGVGIPENGGVSRAGGGGTARGRARNFLVVAGKAPALFAARDQRDDLARPDGLCGDCAGSFADFARGADGGTLSVRATAFSPRGTAEHHCDCRADLVAVETFLARRFQLSTFFLGCRSH